ncbi:MAG: hypothetical protein HUJ89_04685 [Bacteroidales bacterium]|nr:hypothetical protein [Bacteroidales bacterium]
MKRLFCIFAAAALVCACVDYSFEEASQVAEIFVKSYIVCDYETAAEYCESGLAARVEDRKAEFEALSEAMRAEVKAQAAEIKSSFRQIPDDRDGVVALEYKIGQKTYKMLLTKSDKWRVSSLEAMDAAGN